MSILDRLDKTSEELDRLVKRSLLCPPYLAQEADIRDLLIDAAKHIRVLSTQTLSPPAKHGIDLVKASPL